jgi:hypothetical protein
MDLISPIFYGQLFHTKSFLRSFYVLTNWVCNFLAKGFWCKTAHRMLVKLTPGNSCAGACTLKLFTAVIVAVS